MWRHFWTTSSKKISNYCFYLKTHEAAVTWIVGIRIQARFLAHEGSIRCCCGCCCCCCGGGGGGCCCGCRRRRRSCCRCSRGRCWGKVALVDVVFVSAGECLRVKEESTIAWQLCDDPLCSLGVQLAIVVCRTASFLDHAEKSVCLILPAR